MGKASGSIDLRALRKGTAYITEITDNGIFVHDDGDPTTPTASAAKGVHITSNSVDIIDNNGVANAGSVASFGSNVRVGKIADKHITIDANGIDLVNGNDSLGNFNIDNNGAVIRIGENNDNHIIVNSNGIDISDGSDSIANFGSSVRVGKENNAHFTVGDNSLTGYSGGVSPYKYFEVGGGNNKVVQEYTGNGNTTQYVLQDPVNDGEFKVYINNSLVINYQVDYTNGYITFNSAPSNGASIKITYTSGLTSRYFTFGNRLNEENNIKGINSTTFGQDVIATGVNSFAQGFGSQAVEDCSVAIGKDASGKGKMFAVGCGDYGTGFSVDLKGNCATPKNATINGNTTIGGNTIIGGNIIVDGQFKAGNESDGIKPLFSVDEHHHTAIPISADGNYTHLREITKSGYRAIAVTGCEIRDNSTGQDTTKCVMSQLYVYRTSGKDYVYYNIWNPDTSNSANVQIYFGVLYIAESAF